MLEVRPPLVSSFNGRSLPSGPCVPESKGAAVFSRTCQFPSFFTFTFVRQKGRRDRRPCSLPHDDLEPRCAPSGGAGLVLFGTERIDLPEGASYTGCDGSTAVNITTLAAPRTNRMHYVFRNVFQLRSQGLI